MTGQQDAMERGEARHSIALESPLTNIPHDSQDPTASHLNPSDDSQDDSEAISNLWATIHTIVTKSWNPLKYFKKAHTPEQEESSSAKPIIRTIADCPKGYPKLAAFIDSEQNFMMFRRFGYLQTRLLLHKQDQLRYLEWELDQIDKEQLVEDPRLLFRRRSDDDKSGVRKKKLAQIEETFGEYSSLLVTARDLVSLSPPSNEDWASVFHFHEVEQPTIEEEKYIRHREDLITLRACEENTWLDNFIQRFLCKSTTGFIQNLLSTSDLRKKTEQPNPDINYCEVLIFDRDRVKMVVSLIMTTAVVAILILPVYILWHLTDSNKSSAPGASTNSVSSGSSHSQGTIIGILLAFTLLFSLVLTLFTSARRHEVLASAAAYCAVLVVFLGNLG